MNQKENRNYTSGSIFSRLKGYYLHMCGQTDLRIQTLKSLLQAGEFNSFIKHAGRFAGRQPSLHIETGLLKRVQKAGYSHLVQQFKVQEDSFREQLDKAETAMASEPKFTGSTDKLVQAALRVHQMCRFPNQRFTPTTVDYAAENQVNKQSSASFPFYVRKGKVLQELKTLAEIAKKDHKSWLWPMTRGFRIQLRYGKSNELVPKVRVMYPYPGHIILLEDSFIIPFVQHFINTDTFYVIGKNGFGVGNRLRSILGNSNNVTSLDVSGYDQNLVKEASIMAFSILRMQLKLTKEEMDTFEKIVTYFCSSLMVSKVKGSQSYGFIKTNGVPSGSGFTNMIDTLAHAIILEYLEPNILNRCLICGDDNIFDSTNINTTNLFKGYLEVFNLTVSLEKTDHYTSTHKINFLGFTWINFVRHVDLKLVINQVLWHTDFLTDLDLYERELARAASVLLNGINGRDIFNKLFPDIVSQLNKGYDVRFIYLYGYQPPTSLPGVVSYQKLRGPIPNTNQSLLLHLKQGWLIR